MTEVNIDMTLRGLVRTDEAAVRSLHDRAIAGLNRPDWVRPEPAEFFAPVLAEGLSLGLFAEGALQGYALLQCQLEPGDDPAAKVGLPGQAFAKLCGCSIAPEWRGHGAQQRLSRARIALGRARGVSRFFATAAPGNLASWLSLLRAGLTIGALGEKYGGHLRYTLVLTEGQAEGAGEWMDLQDLEGQRRALGEGWRGTEARPGQIRFQPWQL